MKTARPFNLRSTVVLLLIAALAARTVNSGNTPPIILAQEPTRFNVTSHQSAVGWQSECVDCPRWFSSMTDRSLRLDPAGYPHIAYGGVGLYYARYDGAAWQIEIVDEAFGLGEYVSAGVGERASLALDGAGHPHISYYDDSNSNLKYARYDGTSWQIETLDNLGHIDDQTSLALDATGRPHISYYDWGDGLKHAWHDGMAWYTETIDSEAYGYPSLAIDSTDRPHVSYRSASGLKYARRDGTTWHTEMVDATGTVDEYTSIALDELGRPHISYYEWTNQDLRYARYDGTTWHTETVDSEGDVGNTTSIALDKSGWPHISYYDRTNQDLKYARRDSTTWRIETVESEGIVGWYPSLALDGAGGVHISYLDYGTDELKYARRRGATWQIESVDERRDVGSYNSLALEDAPGAYRPHIAYGGSNKDLMHAWHDGATWHTETVDSDGDVGSSTSIALDELGRPHISYYDETNGDLKYAWHDGTTWHIETVDSAGEVGRYTSLALDRLDRPHISYYDATNKNLKYAWHDGSSWHVETVDSASRSLSSSLALDGAGRPHISYHGVDELKYARHDGIVWHIETVDDTKGADWDPSLALDTEGHPHISYSDDRWDYCDLKYARHDGTNWQVETIPTPREPFLWCASRSSLALDRLNHPHIAYCLYETDISFTCVDLQYIRHDGATWQIETIFPDSYWRVTSSISLALDGWGQPHLSFYDRPYRALKYAWRVPVLPLLDKQATPRDGLHNNETLTYTLTLSGPGLTVRLWDPLPPTVRYVTGSLTSTINPTAVYSPATHAVIWGGTLPTDTVGVVRFQVTPGITGAGSLDLSVPIANRAWLTDTHSGQGVSATVIVNGWRVYLPTMMRND